MRSRLLAVVDRILRWLGVERPERSLVLRATLFQLSFVAGVSVLKAASNALLASTGALPILYIASSLLTGVVTAWSTHPSVRALLPSGGIVLGGWPPTPTLGMWGLSFLSLSLAVRSHVPWSIELLYLAAELYATTVSVRFWGQVGDLFDPRQARRLLGVVGGVGMAGSILGGLIARVLGPPLGALGLVPIGTASLVVCVLVAPRLVRKARQSASPQRRVGSDPKSSGSGSTTEHGSRGGVWSHPLTGQLALLAALLAAVTGFSDFVFRARAKELLDHGAQAALFGELSIVVGLVAMGLQLGLTTPLLRRMGLFGYLSLVPVACVVLGGGALLWPGLAPVYALKAVEQVGALSLTQTGMQLLYGPLPDALRTGVRAAVDGLAKKAGFALSGAVLLAAGAQLGVSTPTLAAGGVIAAGLGALGAIGRLRRGYLRAVTDRLQRRAPVPDAGLSLAAGTSRQLLEAALTSPDAGRVRAALDLLKREPQASLARQLPLLIEHNDAGIRRTSIELSARLGAQSVSVRVGQRALSDPDPEVQCAAIGAFARLRSMAAPRHLSPLLEHDSLQIRAATIAALVPLEAVDPPGPARTALVRLLEQKSSLSPDDRATVARLLGALGPAVAASHLRDCLTDASPIVRRAACLAAGQSRDPVWIDDLWPLLVARETRPAARQALVRYGDRIVSRLESLLNDRSTVPDLRYRIPRLLREIGTPRALEAILFSNPVDDAFLQFRLSEAAGRIREAHPDIVFDRQRAREATERRLELYEELLPASADLMVALGPGNLLVRAVGDRLDQHLEAAVRLIGMTGPNRDVWNAFNRFVHGDARTQPYAIELLEHLIEDGSISRRMVTLLERWHRRPDAVHQGNLQRAPGRLLELVGARDPILRALAIVQVRLLARARAGSHPPPARVLRSAEAAAESASGIHVLARLARGPAWDVLLGAPPPIPEEHHVSEQILETVLILQGVDIFAESNVDDLLAVAQHVRQRRLAAGTTIYAENDPGDALYVLVDGRVVITHEGRPILDVAPGEAFGETSLLDNKPRPATARAATDVTVLMLERTDFMDLLSDRVELLRGVFSALTRHLREVLDRTSPSRTLAAGGGQRASPSRPPPTAQDSR